MGRGQYHELDGRSLRTQVRALEGRKGVEMPEPAVTDRATIAAHLAAFGSANVRSLYQAWRSAITAIETEEQHCDGK